MLQERLRIPGFFSTLRQTVVFWGKSKAVPVRFKLYFQRTLEMVDGLASLGIVLNGNTEIKHSLHFQLDAIQLEPA